MRATGPAGDLLLLAPLPYQVVEKKDISYAGVARATLRVVVNAQGEPQDEALEQVAQRVWAEHGKSFDEVTVFCYLPDMDPYSPAYAVAEFTPSGLREFKVENFLKEGRRKPSSVPRLSDDTRKQVFAALLAAEDRAARDAEQRFPISAGQGTDFMKYAKLSRQLSQDYVAEVWRTYGITEEEARAVGIEGVTKGW
jgi:hypothetical protein